MNNEEKILAILEQMQVDISGLKQGQDKTNERLDSIEQRTLKIEITQENTVVPYIKLLAEGVSGVADKLKGLDIVAEKVEDIENTANVLGYIIAKK